MKHETMLPEDRLDALAELFAAGIVFLADDDQLVLRSEMLVAQAVELEEDVEAFASCC